MPRELKAEVEEHTSCTMVFIRAEQGEHAEYRRELEEQGKIPEQAIVVNMLPGDENL